MVLVGLRLISVMDRDSRKSRQKSAKATTYFEINHEKHGIKIQCIFLATHSLHDTLTAFFKMDELDD